jgi:hypothetical protein
MEPRGLTNSREELLLCASVSVLLSCGVGNVLLAVTESVVWPLILGVMWLVVAAIVTGLASATTPPRSRTSYLIQAPVRRVIEARRQGSAGLGSARSHAGSGIGCHRGRVLPDGARTAQE